MISKKSISLAVATILSIGFVGCGGGDNSSTPASTTQPTQPTPTAVIVERGKVYDATVVDSQNNVATQQTGTNVYVFDDIPKYPVIVTGGWIDVNNDGRKTVADIPLSTPMKSYSTNVTPVTTYLADANKTIRQDRLDALATKTGVSADELLELPSTGTTDAMLVQNSVYKEMKLATSISDINVSSIKNEFNSLKAIATQNIDKNASQLSVIIEKEVVSNLVTSGKITHIPLSNATGMTQNEKNKYSLGISKDDFVLSNTLVDFISVTDANLSTQYESNEITFEGINVPLDIAINNSNFSIIKNGTSLTGTNTTVSNGDKIKLRLITSGNFSDTQSVTLSIKDKFTDIAEKINLVNAKKLCSDSGLSLPTGTALNTYYTANTNKFPSNVINYWVSDNASLNGFVMEYNTNTRTTSETLGDSNSGTICTKHYNDLLFAVTTKSDPNQAPVAKAGIDQKVYYTDPVTLSASASSDDTGIVSYEWKDGTTLLSNDENFTKTDFSVGTHSITLKVTDEGGKTATDTVQVVLFNTFTNLLPMQDAGGIKSISSFSNNGATTITLGAGSSSFFKITNNTKRTFTITKFEIKTTYNGSTTTRVSSSNIASVLGSDKLLAGKAVALGHTLQSSETANVWTATYYLTDDATGTTFTNSTTWNGSTFY